LVSIFRRFQSTPPERGATSSNWSPTTFTIVSIHAPREGSDAPYHCRTTGATGFNPRPPRGERHIEMLFAKGAGLFQSTPPERGATTEAPQRRASYDVSIHAPREGSDVRLDVSTISIYCFNPRPPRGERLRTDRCISLARAFQSTPPERGATCMLKSSR